jgi:ribosome-binding protein aMBF1 (putative translation factor)
MRVRCSFCGAEYEAAVTRAALVVVDRCAQCGRRRLRAAEPNEADNESPTRGNHADPPTGGRAA